MAIIHMLLIIKSKPNKKCHLAHGQIILLVIKQKINRKFGMETQFLFKKISFLISQNFDLRIRQV